jgi:serine/threonine protein kinase/tetratricopeptide (TPR) repeat protein
MDSAQSIGPYRILEPLGHGGMGVVYRARHAMSERAVALKTVKVSAPRWLESIRREIDALTRIRHPGIVRIVDHGVQDGRPWYAMDLLEGESLRRFGQRIWSPYAMPKSAHVGSNDQVSATEELTDAGGDARLEGAVPGGQILARPAGGAIPAAAGELQLVLRLMRRVCSTLAFLHGEGFVNCDLKPENVLIVDGKPVVIDFGLTSQHPGGSGREAAEVQRAMSGTLPYMSPEQIRGEFVDARSDLYSLGCVLYELVTGRTPFVGAPRSIVNQHLSSAPVPPSELVGDVPPELERVILRLLEKSLRDRFGFADEVAAVLAALSHDIARIANFPPARPYLYRPRFVGREDVVAGLASRRDRAAAGAGSFVLLAGESGIGKTRVAMELTRGARLRTVISEAATLATDGTSPNLAPPLQTVRPVLRAIADRCQEGGPDVTERLLGERRAVLAPYEPLLAQVPHAESGPPPVALSVDHARQRLFASLSEAIAAFAREQPVLWVIDDLGWADELSLDFLASLTPAYLESTPLFILGTYRPEDVAERVAFLARLPSVSHLTLSRLSEEAVASMIADMLALPEPRQDFVEFVTQQAEGNPFFVAEHVRTAVTEQVFYRDQQNAWRLREPPSSSASGSYDLLPQPRSILTLIDHRLRTLTPAAQQVCLATAVLGREAQLDAVWGVAAISAEAATRAVDELLRRQVFEQPAVGSVRFLHDKLREVAYAQAPAERLRELHARAGATLEAWLANRPEPSRYWGTLGHHFAAARLPEPAARFLTLAAHHARSTYAKGDAARLYQEAINHTRLLGQKPALLELSEAQGDVLFSMGRRAEARGAYDEALSLVPAADLVGRARLHRKNGKSWETEHRHDDALRCYDSARLILASASSDTGDSPGLRDEWFQVRIDQLWVYYFLDRVGDMEPLIAELESTVHGRPTPLQRARLLRTLWMRNLRRDRYVASDETTRIARAALSAAEESADHEQLCVDQFGLGFVLLFRPQPDEARQELQRALDLASQFGDVSRRARCLTYLTLTFRMEGQYRSTREHLDKSLQAALESGSREYLAAARANQSWVALRAGDLTTADRSARDALAIWQPQSIVYPLQWLALLPLLAVTLQNGQTAAAVECASRVLDRSQQVIPSRATELFERAVRMSETGEDAGVQDVLRLGLSSLKGTVYE